MTEESWRAKALTAVDACRTLDPRGWADYLAEADAMAQADAYVSEGWTPGQR